MTVKNSFNTQPPEGGWILRGVVELETGVSTHSRPKAAGSVNARRNPSCNRFNTQPPEGGWTA